MSRFKALGRFVMEARAPSKKAQPKHIQSKIKMDRKSVEERTSRRYSRRGALDKKAQPKHIQSKIKMDRKSVVDRTLRKHFRRAALDKKARAEKSKKKRELVEEIAAGIAGVGVFGGGVAAKYHSNEKERKKRERDARNKRAKPPQYRQLAEYLNMPVGGKKLSVAKKRKPKPPYRN